MKAPHPTTFKGLARSAIFDDLGRRNGSIHRDLGRRLVLLLMMSLASCTLILATFSSSPQPVSASHAHANAASPMAAPVPAVQWLDGPKAALIGGSVTFHLSFDNTGTGAGSTGYAPFLDLVLDAHGLDGNAMFTGITHKCDGITLAGVTFANVVGSAPFDTAIDVPADKILCASSTALGHVHPLTGKFVNVPVGYQFVTIPLPIGSFTSNEPVLAFAVTIDISDFADDGLPRELYARGGFELGASASGGTPIVSHPDDALTWDRTLVTPVVVTTEKKYLGPEKENATGPSHMSGYPLRYQITVNIAPGQTITDLEIKDMLPNNQTFVGVDPNPAVTTPGYTVTGPGSTPANGAEFVVGYSSASGKITVEYEFFTPLLDADGAQVVNLNTCEPSESVNDIAVSAEWDPLDPRDDPKTVMYDFDPEDEKIFNKCGAIQKSVTQVTDHGVDGPSPADILEYTLSIQVSDFTAMGAIVVEDWLADGQQLITSGVPPMMEVSDRSHPTPLALSWPEGEPSITVTSDPSTSCGGTYPNTSLAYSVNGITRIEFDVSQRLVDAPPTGSSTLDSGIVLGAGTTSTPGIVTIVFRTRIMNTYENPQPGNPNVDKHDPVCNQVFLRGRKAEPEDVGLWVLTPTEIHDDSASSLQIPGDTLTKSVYARNGDVGGWTTGTSGLPQFGAGDEITFEIEKTDLTGDGESVSITDWVPQPVLSVAGFTPGTIPLCTGSTPPPLDGMCYFHSPSNMGIASPLPALTTDVSSQSFGVDFGDITTDLAQKHTLGIRFTLEIAKAKYKDGLHLENLVRECEKNTFDVSYCQIAIAEFEITAPALRITKGLVWAESEDGEFRPEPPSGAVVPFAPPGTCPRFLTSPEITSGSQIDYDLDFVDANDKITYAIVVENYGAGVNGAFDVKIEDAYPPFASGSTGKAVGGTLALCVADGSGKVFTQGLDYNLVSSGPSGFVLELIDSTLKGKLPAPDPIKPGENVLVITYDLLVDPKIAIDCYTNTTQVTAYSNTDGGAASGDNYVDPGHEPKDTAEFCVLPKAGKSIVKSSEAHTVPEAAQGVGPLPKQTTIPELTIGEIVVYELEVNVPEGVHPNFTIQDVLAEELVPLVGTIADVTISVPSVVTTGPPSLPGPPPPPPWACGAANQPPLEIDFGTVTNNVGNGWQTIKVEFAALVCNTAKNKAGDSLTEDKVNTFNVLQDSKVRATAHVTSTIVEPRVNISKTLITPVTELTLGQTLEYEITVSNPSDGITAYNLQVWDPMPACLTAPKLAPGTTIVPPSPDPGLVYAFNFGLARILLDQLEPGQSVSFRYTTTVKCLDCEKLENTARVIWTSLPKTGTPNGASGNATGFETTAVSGAVNGERNHKDGPGGVNDYVVSGSFSLCGGICGWKWSDDDKDGAWDVSGEVGLDGWQISAENSSTGAITTVPTGPNTDPNDPRFGDPGWYCMVLLPGAYQLSENVKSGYEQTAPIPKAPTIIVGPGDEHLVDFGNYDMSLCTIDIGGVKYLDANGNGTFDLGEQPLPGWTIQVHDTSGKLIDVAVTDSNGKYTLTLPPSVELTISEVHQPGYTQTEPDPPGTYGAYVLECPVPFAIVWPRSSGTWQTYNPADAIDPAKVNFGNRPSAFCIDKNDWIDYAGPIVAWGENTAGVAMTDIGGIPATSSPVVVPGSYIDVATGTMHTVALDVGGLVHVWGPQVLIDSRPTGGGYTQVAAGTGFSLALHADGHIDSWGWNGGFQHDIGNCTQIAGQSAGWQTCHTNTGDVFTSVGAGWDHSLAVDAAGVLHSLGKNNAMKLPGCIWVTDTSCTLPTAPGSAIVFDAVSGGYSHSLATDMMGRLHGWGAVFDNQHPGGSSSYGLDSQGHIDFSAGALHSLAIVWNGFQSAIKPWGKTTDPNVTTTPTSGDYLRVAAGQTHSMAIDDNLHLIGWGHSLWTSGPPLVAPPNRYADIAASGGGGAIANPRTVHGVAIGCQEPCGQVCGTKYADVNENGVRDGGEKGLADWLMLLRDVSGKVVASAKTDANGQYCLTIPYTASSTEFKITEHQTVVSLKHWFQTEPAKGVGYTVHADCSTGPGITACLTGDPSTCGTIASGALDFGNHFKHKIDDSWLSIHTVDDTPVSSALSSWPAERLADADRDSVWSSRVHTEHLAWSEWAAIQLDTPQEISRVRLVPRADPDNPGGSLGFPKDFVVQYSLDDGDRTCDSSDPRFSSLANWIPAVTRFGFPQPSDSAIDFELEPTVAGCVRVFGAELSQDNFGNRYLQLAEIEAHGEGGEPLPASVAASSALGSWPAARLVDGDWQTVWSSRPHTEHLAWSEWAAVRLAEPAEIARVSLVPRSDPDNPGGSLGFPKDFVVQYSLDDEDHTCNPSDPRFSSLANWIPAVTKFGYPQPADVSVDFALEPRLAGCARVFGAELSQDNFGNRYLQLAEIEVRDADRSVLPASAVVSSALGSWPAERLTDGDPETVWSSRVHTEHLAWSEWASVRLAEPAEISRVRVIPRSDPDNPGDSLGFPKDFVVQYSRDDEDHTCYPGDPRFADLGNWIPAVTKFGYPQPSEGPVDFDFEPSVAGCVRVFGAELSQDNFKNRYLQLAEIEVLSRIHLP